MKASRQWQIGMSKGEMKLNSIEAKEQHQVSNLNSHNSCMYSDVELSLVRSSNLLNFGSDKSCGFDPKCSASILWCSKFGVWCD